MDEDTVLQDAVYALNYQPIYSAMSPVARIHRAKKPRGEVELTPFIITLGTSLQKLPFL